MAKSKYYAVRKGKKTGIFESWDECKKNVAGVSGATYKSFLTYQEASEYMSLGAATAASESSGAADSDDIDRLVAYVDGSFNQKIKRYSFGCVLITPQGDIHEECGSDNVPEALVNRNVAGELDGALYAITWAYENGYKKIRVYHDYEGISKWFTGEWAAKSYSAKRYLEHLAKYRNELDITFQKVKAHTGDRYNELADQLANKALN